MERSHAEYPHRIGLHLQRRRPSIAHHAQRPGETGALFVQRFQRVQGQIGRTQFVATLSNASTAEDEAMDRTDGDATANGTGGSASSGNPSPGSSNTNGSTSSPGVYPTQDTAPGTKVDYRVQIMTSDRKVPKNSSRFGPYRGEVTEMLRRGVQILRGVRGILQRSVIFAKQVAQPVQGMLSSFRSSATNALRLPKHAAWNNAGIARYGQTGLLTDRNKPGHRR